MTDAVYEIEITPEMVMAGMRAYWKLDLDHDPYERIVSEVFQAMWLAADGTLTLNEKPQYSLTEFREACASNAVTATEANADADLLLDVAHHEKRSGNVE